MEIKLSTLLVFILLPFSVNAKLTAEQCPDLKAELVTEMSQSVFHKAAEDGSPMAQYYMAVSYYGHDDIKNQDYNKALEWLEKSAEQGLMEAQFDLSQFYLKGYTAKKDKSKAVYWLKKAAEQGYMVAQYNLGVLYYNGIGVKQNHQCSL